MDPRAFKSVNENALKLWLGNILGLDSDGNKGIDLFDDKIGIELKTHDSYWNHRIPVHEYQLHEFPHEHPGKELFWAFLFYTARKRPSDIKPEEINRNVKSREVWFTEWDFLRPFSVSRPKTGPYIYVPKVSFDSLEYVVYKVRGGVLYAPPGSVLEERLRVPF